MIKGKKVIVVMPAYNAALTLEKTYNEIDFDIVDDVVLVDDNSPDNTVEVAKNLGISYNQSRNLNKEFTSISQNSDNIFITTKINESIKKIYYYGHFH